MRESQLLLCKWCYCPESPFLLIFIFVVTMSLGLLLCLKVSPLIQLYIEYSGKRQNYGRTHFLLAIFGSDSHTVHNRVHGVYW
jgi:hypothetical protein